MSHRLGTHMLSISIRLGRHLGRCHGDLAHLGGGRMRAGQGGTALVRRVREGCEWSSLAMELRSHAGSASVVGIRPEAWVRRERHLSLVTRLRKSASATTVMGIVPSRTRASVAHVVTHVTVSRLRGFASKMGRLGSGSEWSLGSRAHLRERKKLNQYGPSLKMHNSS